MMSTVQRSGPPWWARRKADVLVLSLGLWMATAGSACGRSKEARGETADQAVSAAEPEKSAARFDEAAYAVTLQAVGEYRAGQSGRADVVLVPKEPYHVNTEFPWNLKLRESKGVRYARTVVGKDGAKLEPKRAVVPVEFTPEAPGGKVLAGTLRFSVCNDQRCLVEKRSLELGISVQ